MAARKVPVSEKTLIILINEVKKRRCLWDLDDKYYNDRYKLASAWEEISAILKIPEDVLRAKWKNLRDLFKREERKCLKHTVDDYTGKWRHFKTLWFLNKSESTEATSDTESFDTDVTVVKDENHNQDTYEVLIDNGVQKRLTSNPEIEQDEKKVKFNVVNDYDTMFLQSLTPFFKELEPWRKLVVRNKIQDIILNELAAQKNFELPQS
ncbi:unnamed protein product, partial [Brenthis ino]